MALSKEEFIEAHGLEELREDSEIRLVDRHGGFVCYVCPECGKIQSSVATVKSGKIQPEYCKCWYFDMG